MTIPTNLRAPIMAVEFDSSRAFQGPALLVYQGLLIGGRTSAGSKAEATIQRVTSADQAGEYFGFGSQLHNMAQKWFKNNKATDLYCAALDDAGAGVAATGSFAISGTATAAGSLVVYIAGKRIAVGVNSGDTATVVGDALEAAIGTLASEVKEYPVLASNATGTVTLTAKNKGEPGNDIDLRVNLNDGEVLPAGISVTVNAMATGASNPDIQDIIDILGDEWYQIICAPYTDATNLTAIETELADRFGPLRQIDGLYFCAKDDTLSNLTTFGNGRNSPHVSCFEAKDTLSAPYELAAGIAGQVAAEGSADPARPFQTLTLVDMVPAPVTERFTYAERNGLLFDGIATINVDRAGVVHIERAITMYQTNAASAPDIAYLNVNTLLTLMYIRYDFVVHIRTKYPRAKLADDGAVIPPGQSIMTPSVGRAEAVAKFRGWELLGLVENIDQFKNDLVVQRSISDPDRLDWILPPDLINQFRVGGATIQFLLAQPVG